jgi:hypothetical protein
MSHRRRLRRGQRDRFTNHVAAGTSHIESTFLSGLADRTRTRPRHGRIGGSALVRRRPRGPAYNEQAFRYFLEIERKRAARAQRPVVLLLMDPKESPRTGARIDPVLAAKLFSGLWRCLRETDVIGWYREDRIAGAVLTQLDDALRPDASSLIRQRVSGTLRDGLSPDVARRLRVRVYQLRPGLKG